jgi:hypothetical protein
MTKPKPVKWWGIFDTLGAVIEVARYREELAKRFPYSLKGGYKIKPVLVTPIERKKK